MGWTREPSGLRDEKAGGNFAGASSGLALARGARAQAEAAAVLFKKRRRDDSNKESDVDFCMAGKRFIRTKRGLSSRNMHSTEKKAEWPLPLELKIGGLVPLVHCGFDGG